MARAHIRRKYTQTRKEFRKEMREALMNNRALGMAILNGYVANKHRTHIHKIWYLLGTKHKDAWRDYRESGLSGKMLCGDENLYDTIYFSGYEDIAKKYKGKLPEKVAFGEIHGMIIRCVNGKEI